MSGDLTNPGPPSPTQAPEPAPGFSGLPVERQPTPGAPLGLEAAQPANGQDQEAVAPDQPRLAGPAEASGLSQQAQQTETQAPAPPTHPQRPDLNEPAAATGAGESSPRLHDFRSAPLLTAAELRRAELKHEQFARALSTRLSIYLRVEFLAQVGMLQVLSPPQFIAALPQPAHFTLFRLEPVCGLGIVAMPLGLSLALVDRLLGGSGQGDHTHRALTEVERAVLDLLTTQMLKEWSQTVMAVTEVRPQILGHETHPRFLPVGAPNGPLLHVGLQAQLGQVTEPLHLAFPFASIETVLRQQVAATQAQAAEPDPASLEPLQWHAGLDQIPLKLTAGWDDLQMTAQQLANLNVGDWLPLEPHRFNHVHIRLARQPKFIGRLGTAKGARAIELIGPIEPGQPLVS